MVQIADHAIIRNAVDPPVMWSSSGLSYGLDCFDTDSESSIEIEVAGSLSRLFRYTMVASITSTVPWFSALVNRTYERALLSRDPWWPLGS